MSSGTQQRTSASQVGEPAGQGRPAVGGQQHPAMEHHTKAAEHHRAAAKHHDEAAQHYAGGRYAEAAQEAHHATGHTAVATHHAREAAKVHATHDSTKK